MTHLGECVHLDDGPTLQELADLIGVELRLPEPGDTGISTDLAVQLYWPGAIAGGGLNVSPRPGPTGYQWHAWGPMGGTYGVSPTRQDAERAARQARATLCRKVGR